jgi:hypothetical protein
MRERRRALGSDFLGKMISKCSVSMTNKLWPGARIGPAPAGRAKREKTEAKTRGRILFRSLVLDGIFSVYFDIHFYAKELHALSALYLMGRAAYSIFLSEGAKA